MESIIGNRLAGNIVFLDPIAGRIVSGGAGWKKVRDIRPLGDTFSDRQRPYWFTRVSVNDKPLIFP